MYYAERTINNVLYYKNSPKGLWIEFSKVMLTSRIEELESKLLEELENSLLEEFNQ
jgi:hypothetical protein